MSSLHEYPAELLINTAVGPNGAPIVTLSGELDSAKARSLASVVDAISATKPPELFFDLSDLRSMDSAGIAILLRASRGSEVHLPHVSRMVRRVIEVTGLTDVLPLES